MNKSVSVKAKLSVNSEKKNAKFAKSTSGTQNSSRASFKSLA